MSLFYWPHNKVTICPSFPQEIFVKSPAAQRDVTFITPLKAIEMNNLVLYLNRNRLLQNRNSQESPQRVFSCVCVMGYCESILSKILIKYNIAFVSHVQKKRKKRKSCPFSHYTVSNFSINVIMYLQCIL